LSYDLPDEPDSPWQTFTSSQWYVYDEENVTYNWTNDVTEAVLTSIGDLSRLVNPEL
jgi:hypothetical protein